MRNGGHVLDAGDADAESVQSAHGRFTAGAGAFDADFDVLQTEFESLLAGVFGGNLSREGRGLTRALEALSTGRGRRNGVALTSVIVMIVLLKEACTWAMPSVTTFFTFLRARAAC